MTKPQVKTEDQPVFMSGLQWITEAKCRGIDSEVFFDPDKAAQAKSICAECPYSYPNSTKCVELVTYRDRGIWGGLTQRERRALKDAEVH